MKPLSVKSERGFVVLGGPRRGCPRVKAALVVGVYADSSVCFGLGVLAFGVWSVVLMRA